TRIPRRCLTIIWSPWTGENSFSRERKWKNYDPVLYNLMIRSKHLTWLFSKILTTAIRKPLKELKTCMENSLASLLSTTSRKNWKEILKNWIFLRIQRLSEITGGKF